MVRLDIAIVLPVLIYNCTAAALRQFDFCHLYNRQQLAISQTCGDCLQGYVTNDEGYCVKDICPDSEHCRQKKRLACSFKTDGKCGDCIEGHFPIQGVCVTQKEVRELIEEIEQMLSEPVAPSDTGKGGVAMSDAGKSEVVTSETGKGGAATSASGEDVFLDKKAQASVNGETIVSPETPTDVEDHVKADELISQPRILSNAEEEADEKKPTGSKRAPAGNDESRHTSVHIEDTRPGFSQIVFFAVVLSISLLCVTSLVVAGICWYRLHKQRKLTEPTDYAGYGGDYSKKSSLSHSESGDRKLAQSAQMYHYQHHKQQMMALEKSLSDKLDDSDADDEPEENEDGNYTVYECPGLAPTGEMEVQNPLFQAGNNNKASSLGSPTLSNKSDVSPTEDNP